MLFHCFSVFLSSPPVSSRTPPRSLRRRYAVPACRPCYGAYICPAMCFVWTARLSRRKMLCAVQRVNMSDRAVDPTEAKRLLDRIVIGKARLARLFHRKQKPYFFFGFKMLLKSRPPFDTIGGVKNAVNHRISFQSNKLSCPFFTRYSRR